MYKDLEGENEKNFEIKEAQAVYRVDSSSDELGSKSSFRKIGQVDAGIIVPYSDFIDLKADVKILKNNDERLSSDIDDLKSETKEIKLSIKALDDKFEKRFEKVDGRFDKIDVKFDKIDERFDKIDEKFGKIDEKFDKIGKDNEELKKWVHSELKAQRWFMVGTILTMVGIAVTIN